MGRNDRMRGARCLAATLAVVVASSAALAQEPATGEQEKPVDAAFTRIGQDWLRERLPDAEALRGQKQSFSSEYVQRPRRRSGDGERAPEFRPTTPFPGTQDQLGVTPVVDIRDQARAYIKQRLVSEILSRSALGRGLSVFIDTGSNTFSPERSKMLPFISPKFKASEGGKVALQFTWKF
jgi:hypothetical protein